MAWNEAVMVLESIDDQILVVADRKIREAGTRAELMRRAGLYAELYSLQARAHQ